MPKHGKSRRLAALTFAFGLALAIAVVPSTSEHFQIMPQALAESTTQAAGGTFETGLGTVRIPRFEVDGASFEAALLPGLLTSGSADEVIRSVESLTARRIRIPELVFEQRPIGMQQTITYRDVVIEDVAGGKASRMAVAGAEISGIGPSGEPISGRIGAMSAKNIDAAATLRVLMTTASDPAAPLALLYESFDLAGYEMTMGTQVKMRVGPVTARGIRMRSTSVPLGQLIERMAIVVPTTPGAKPGEAELRKLAELMPAMLEIYRAYAVDEATVRDISLETASPEGPVEMGFAGIRMAGFADAKLNEMSIDGMKLRGKAGTFDIGQLTLKKFDFGAMLASMETMMQTAQSAGADAATLSGRPIAMPRFEEFALKSLAIDMMVPVQPVPGADGSAEGTTSAAAELRRMNMTLDAASLGLPVWSSMYPTSVDLKIDGLQMHYDPTDPSLAVMQAMGLGDLADAKSSMRVVADYEEAAKRLKLSELSLTTEKLGHTGLKGVAEGLSADMLSPDPSVAAAALQNMRVVSAEYTFEDRGAMNLIMTAGASMTNSPIDDYRAQMKNTMMLLTRQMLGESEESVALATGIGSLFDGDRRLKITASSLQGIGIEEIADPRAILGKADIVVETGN